MFTRITSLPNVHYAYFSYFCNINNKSKKNCQMKKTIHLLLCLLLATPVAAQRMQNTKSAQTTFLHPWAGKRVAYFGDSITDPRNSGSKKKYWNFLQELLNITPYVYGKSGRQWNDIPRQAEQLKQEHGTDFDAIVIFMGTNDYNNAVPIGEWFEETEDSVVAARDTRWVKRKYLRKKRTPAMDADTYRGRINIALSRLKTMYPTKQIVLLTPIHRALFYGNEHNIQPSEEYQNAVGIYFDRYVESVKEAGNIWAVPVIDLRSAMKGQPYSTTLQKTVFTPMMPVTAEWHRHSTIGWPPCRVVFSLGGQRTTVALTMRISSRGRSCSSVSAHCICLTTSNPSVTSPNTVYCPSR